MPDLDPTDLYRCRDLWCAPHGFTTKKICDYGHFHATVWIERNPNAPK